MEPSDKEQGKKKVTEVKTFSVPFPLDEIKTNITITTNTPSKPSKDKIINQAIQFHLKGNISEASKCYQYFIDQGFIDHRVFSNYGLILKDIGKLKEAVLLYNKAIEIKPNFAEAHSNLGTILRDLGKLKEAEVSTRKAIEINPDYADAHTNLGIILNDQGKLEEAELSQRRAIQIKPNRLSYFNYAGCLFDKRSLDEAKINLIKAKALTGNEIENCLLSAAESGINYAKKKSTSQSKSDHVESSKGFNKIVLHRTVETELLSYLYTLKNKQLETTKDARYGKGLCSTDFKLFQDNSKII